MKRAALLGAMLAAMPVPALAQEFSVLLGGAQARYADSVSGTAGYVSARLAATGSVGAGVFDASFSQFTSGEWAAQLSGRATLLAVSSRRFSIGLATDTHLDLLQGDLWTGTASLGPTLALGGAAFLGTLAARYERIRTVDETATSALRGGVRLQNTPSQELALNVGISATASDTIQFVDASAGFTVQFPRLYAGASGGVRIGELSDDPWGQLRVGFVVTPWVVVESSVGRYPRDLEGFTDGFYATAGARINLSGQARALYSAFRQPMTLERLADGRVRLTVALSQDAERLEIAAEWNEWMPVALRYEGRRRWSLELNLEPGIYQYSLVLDGITWMVPDDVPTVPDEFGGRVALLVVR